MTIIANKRKNEIIYTGSKNFKDKIEDRTLLGLLYKWLKDDLITILSLVVSSFLLCFALFHAVNYSSYTSESVYEAKTKGGTISEQTQEDLVEILNNPRYMGEAIGQSKLRDVSVSVDKDIPNKVKIKLSSTSKQTLEAFNNSFRKKTSEVVESQLDSIESFRLISDNYRVDTSKVILLYSATTAVTLCALLFLVWMRKEEKSETRNFTGD